MNERIIELAEEAGFYIKHDDGSIFIPTTSENITAVQKRFAELIIKECMTVCKAQQNPQNLNYKPSEKFAYAIGSHFGVY